MANTTLEQKLQHVKQTLALAEKYDHAVNVLSYDQETICPIDAMEEQGEVWAFLNNQSYKLIKDPAFIEAAEYLYEHREEADHNALTLTLRALLMGSRKEGF
jgi:carboxypeptidase Taq